MISKHIFENVTELSRQFTEFLLEISKDKPQVNISLSGGSTPKALFDYWAKHGKNDLPWKKLRFFWGDERCVPPTDPMSNFQMTNVHLFSHVPVPPENIFRIKGESNPEDEAARYEEVLLKEIPRENGMPRFDLMILGLGDDGHTASIFPEQIHLWDYQNLCAVARHPETGMKRVSLTGGVINNSENVVFLVTGKSKSEKVRDIISNGEKWLEKYPAARVKPASGHLHWFLDKEAASLL